ncbi:hypothetical protein KDA11_02915 [Candidatus Saccharibacteria bacterium]|nr:hypothetical protein [Candidatus Saccharibacteria bacterium]
MCDKSARQKHRRYEDDDDYSEWYYQNDWEGLPKFCVAERANEDIRKFQMQYNHTNEPVVLRPQIKNFEGRSQYGENYARPYDPISGKYYYESRDEVEFGLPCEAEAYAQQRRKCGCNPWSSTIVPSCGRCGNGITDGTATGSGGGYGPGWNEGPGMAVRQGNRQCRPNLCVRNGKECSQGCFQGFDPRDIANNTPSRVGFMGAYNCLRAEDYVTKRVLQQQRRAARNPAQRKQCARRMAAFTEQINAYDTFVPFWERRDRW